MATYFKYAEREADSQINWAEVGKNMSDMLKEQNRIREEKKAAIDKASQEFGEQLSRPPQGDFKAMNQWTLEYSNDYQQARLMQDKLLKSGQLKVNDYMIMRQNALDGTNQLFDLSKQYQEVYKTKMDRHANSDNQLLEMKLMEQAEGLANFMDHKAYINPTDGSVSIGKMVTGEDGVRKMSDNANDFITVAALGNSIKDEYDRFKSTEAVTGYVEGLGDEINVMTDLRNKYQRGTVTELLDITKRENLPADDKGIVMKFEEAETKMLSGFLTDPLHVTSILTEDIKTAPNGKPYDYTWDEDVAKANPEMILLRNNKAGRPEPVPNAEQEKAALESLRVKARMMYDKKEQVSVVGASETPRQTDSEREAANAKITKQSMLQDWQLLRNGNEEQKKAALDAILGYPSMVSKGLKNIRIEGDKVIFDYADPNMYREVDISDDANAFFRAGREVFGETTEDELKKYATGTKVKAYNSLESKRGEENDYSTYFNKDVDNKGYIAQNDGKKTAAYLASQFADLGFEITGDNAWNGNDTVTIKPTNGQPVTFEVNDQSQVEAIRDFIKNNADPNRVANKYRSQAKSDKSKNQPPKKSKVNYKKK